MVLMASKLIIANWASIYKVFFLCYSGDTIITFGDTMHCNFLIFKICVGLVFPSAIAVFYLFYLLINYFYYLDMVLIVVIWEKLHANWCAAII